MFLIVKEYKFALLFVRNDKKKEPHWW